MIQRFCRFGFKDTYFHPHLVFEKFFFGGKRKDSVLRGGGNFGARKTNESN